MLNDVKRIIKKYKLNVDINPTIIQSLTHSSYANEHNCSDNERLEFLGDSILGFLVAEYLYNNFPNLPEGKMTKLRASYVCEEANTKYAKAIGIDKAIFLGKGEEQNNGRNRPAIISDAFEAFLAAVYLTSGIEEVKKILVKEVFPHIIAEDIVPFVDYKSRLQEYIQAESRKALEYVEDHVEGPAHNRTFTIKVVHDGIVLGVGVGKTKKDASQQAAKVALDKMASN